jgi:hypothetical protein
MLDAKTGVVVLVFLIVVALVWVASKPARQAVQSQGEVDYHQRLQAHYHH